MLKIYVEDEKSLITSWLECNVSQAGKKHAQFQGKILLTGALNLNLCMQLSLMIIVLILNTPSKLGFRCLLKIILTRLCHILVLLFQD